MVHCHSKTKDLRSVQTHSTWAIAVALAVGCAPQPDDPSGGATRGDDATSSGMSAGDDTDGAPPPDLPDAPQSCHVLNQDCPDGDKCIPITQGFESLTWDATTCVSGVADPDEQGEPCELTPSAARDTCAAGLMCADVSDTTQTGTCRPFCPADDQASCGEKAFCSTFPQPVGLCREQCDPLAPTCDAGYSCLPFFDGPGDPNTGFDGFACLPIAPGTIGPPFKCSGLSPGQCEAGSICTPAGALVNPPFEYPQCRRYCQPSLNGSDCSAEMPTCSPLILPPNSAAAELGVCIQ